MTNQENKLKTKKKRHPVFFKIPTAESTKTLTILNGKIKTAGKIKIKCSNLLEWQQQCLKETATVAAKILPMHCGLHVRGGTEGKQMGMT